MWCLLFSLNPRLKICLPNNFHWSCQYNLNKHDCFTIGKIVLSKVRRYIILEYCIFFVILTNKRSKKGTLHIPTHTKYVLWWYQQLCAMISIFKHSPISVYWNFSKYPFLIIFNLDTFYITSSIYIATCHFWEVRSRTQ